MNSPTPDNIRDERVAAGLSQAQAAELLHLGAPTRWGEYERGIHAMSPALWELFLIKVGKHDGYRALKRAATGGATPAMLELAAKAQRPRFPSGPAREMSAAAKAAHSARQNDPGRFRVQSMPYAGAAPTDPDKALRGFGQGPKVKRGGRP